MKKVLGSFVAAGAMLMMAGVSQADDYYKDKTIRFVVGFGAGGGYDAYARMLAPHLAKKLGATVVVENQPGAGGLNALNRFAHAPDNGLQITIVNGTGAATQQLMETKSARFDLSKLKHLGITDYSRWLVLVQPKSPYSTLADMQRAKEPIRFGASGRLDALGVGAAMACKAVGMNCKVVAGYKGSAQVALALAQGEMDALYVSETSAFKFVSSGNAKAITTWNRKRSVLFPDLKSVTELAPLKDDQLWWIDIRNTIESLGRMLAAPPATPKAQVDVLRAAADAVLSDKAVVEEGNRRKRFIKYIPAAEAEAMANKLLAQITPAEKARIKDYLLGKK
jgi:tripartite-type tricarboxylate transporter receptor subunit TctC